jgi:hypothetical protein
MERQVPNDVQVNFRAPRELRRDLRRIAAAQDTNVGTVLLEIARKAVDEFDAQTAAA